MAGLLKRGSAVVLGTALVLSATGAVHAQNLFDMLFGPPRNSFARPAPPPSVFEPILPDESVRRRPAIRRVAPREPVASTAPVMPREAKPPRAAPPAEIVASLMNDTTLERGDIVVFPDGPRVFKGSTGSASHRAADFERVETSSLVPNATRTAVLAATFTSGRAVEATGSLGRTAKRQARGLARVNRARDLALR